MPLQYIDHDHRFPDLTFAIAFVPTIPALYIFWAAVVTPSTFLVFQPSFFFTPGLDLTRPQYVQ